MLKNVAQPERMVTHFGKHAAFIRGIDRSVVVEHDGCDTSTGRVHQINKPRVPGCQHFCQHERGILLYKSYARLVQLNDVLKAFLVKLQPALGVIRHEFLGLDRKAVWGERT
ncbi:hypothetical protein D3C77_628630 [compost metagenome]